MPASALLLAPWLLSLSLSAQEPTGASLVEIVTSAQREELRARAQIKTVQGFQDWKREFAVKAGQQAAPWLEKKLSGDEEMMLARLLVYAADWGAVDEALTRSLAKNVEIPITAYIERIRARAQVRRFAKARADLLYVLENRPERIDMAIYLYALPALVAEEGQALALRVLDILAHRYREDAYAPIVEGLRRQHGTIGKPYVSPRILGRSESEAEDRSKVRLRLKYLFRTGAPMTRAPLVSLSELQRRFAPRGLLIEGVLPREGREFWDRFRPASDRPNVAAEMRSIEAMREQLDLSFPIELTGPATEWEKELGLFVLPHFILLDAEGKSLCFFAGSEGFEWLSAEIEARLDEMDKKR